MPVIIIPTTPAGDPAPLLQKVILPRHGHIVGHDEGLYVDVFGIPPEITHYTVDLINSDLIRVGADGHCAACGGACPCCQDTFATTDDGEQS